ncbi:MAG TPA: hypothetical protein VMU05_24675 [Dongiaceae bacterium]|nr:hypothetical protein [Dongiaceae bacterium]
MTLRQVFLALALTPLIVGPAAKGQCMGCDNSGSCPGGAAGNVIVIYCLDEPPIHVQCCDSTCRLGSDGECGDSNNATCSYTDCNNVIHLINYGCLACL